MLKNKQVYFLSLGCDKNLIDSEKMLALLREAGAVFTDDETQADVIIVNTCCFIGDAKEESIDRILELAGQKQTGRARVLIAAGCLAQRYRSDILTEIPELDGILGVASWHTIVDVVEEALCRLDRDPEKDPAPRPESFLPTGQLNSLRTQRVLTGVGCSASLKIAEGCSKRCTYCIIPYVRGDYVSVPEEEILREASMLAESGVKELVLVAQETTLYGVDFDGRRHLPELLQKLCRIDGIEWIRLMYCYPEEITQELIDVMASEPKLVHYLDLPIQHASDRILRRMGRRTNKAELTERISRLREAIPDIVLRTTLITGFPGETEEDFRELLDFVDQTEFERLGVFCFSAEEGTPAYAMDGQVDSETASRRRDEIMALQQEISASVQEACRDCLFDVLIEGFLPDEGVYVGRTYMDAPGIDSYIFVRSDEPLMSGDIVPVLVTGSDVYDLVGELYVPD